MRSYKWIWLSLVISVPAWGQDRVFAPEVHAALASDATTVAKFRKDSRDHAESLLTDLRTCLARAAKAPALKAKLGARLPSPDSMEAWDRLPLQELAKAANSILVLHAESAKECARLRAFRNGPGEFQLIWDAATAEPYFTLAMNSLWLVDTVGPEALLSLVDWLPSGLRARLPFLSRPWVADFVRRLGEEPEFKAAISELRKHSAGSVRQRGEEVLNALSPTRMHFKNLVDNNQTFPFVSGIPERLNSDTVVSTCLTKPVSFERRLGAKAEEVFQSAISRASEVCPELTREQVLFILAIEDRLPSMILPVTFMRALWSRLAAGAREDEVIDVIRGWEAWTRAQRVAFNNKGVNHLNAPAYLARALTHLPEPELTKSLIYLSGVAYQVFDIEAKLRLNLAIPERAIANSLFDLKLWSRGIELGVLPLP